MSAQTIGRIGKPALAIAFALLVVGAFAGLTDVRTWTDESGDHVWNNKNNWEPKVANSMRNIFPPGRDWEVLVTKSDHYYFSFELAAGEGTVTLKGDEGALSPGTGAFIQIGAGRELKIDGPTFYVTWANILGTDANGNEGFIDGTVRVTSGTFMTCPPSDNLVEQIFGRTAKLIVEGGTFGRNDGIITLTNDATMVVSGGLAKAQRWYLRSPDPPCESITRLRLLGGTLWDNYGYSYMFRVNDGAHFDFRGGTLIWGTGENFRYNCLASAPMINGGQGAAFHEFFPKQGAELVIPSAATNNTGAIYFEVDGDYDFAGTVYATNNTEAVSGSMYLFATNVALRGGGTVYANRVNVYARSNCDADYNWDLSRLNLGIGGIQRTAGNRPQNLNFLDGIVLGAWGGDVPTYAVNRNFTINLNGPVVFDTADCFAPTTPRSISMNRVKMAGVTELKATGGGTVTLAAYTGADELRALEVAADTTLAFTLDSFTASSPTETAAAKLKTQSLKLGANATLKLDLSAGDYVDAAATAEFGEGAKIVVTALPALSEGQFYPVYFAPTGTDPDLSKIEYALGDWPAGWHLAKAGSAVYLTDGKEPKYVSPDPTEVQPRFWSGGGENTEYINSNNWVNGYTTGGGNDACFNGRLNTSVHLGSAITIRRFIFGTESGPFIVSGETLRFQVPISATEYPVTSSIHNEGVFPVVFENLVQKYSSSSALPMRLVADSEGSVILTGGFPSGVSNMILFGGDIRLGGGKSWTTPSVHAVKQSGVRSNGVQDRTKSTVRNARLTVLPGTTLTVTDQSGDFNEDGVGAFAVAATAAVTISGTDLTFTSNNIHYVDGALTVNCPLVPTGRQVFRGDGTLTLAGGVADAPSGGVRLEGNLTLVPAKWFGSAPLAVRDSVTIAPTGDWTFRGDAFELAHHSALTLATGAHTLTLGAPLVSPTSTLTVTGGGTVALGAAGSVLDKVTLADGAKLTLAQAISNGQYADVLAVREDDASIAFEEGCKVSKFVDEETGYTVYSVRKTKRGLNITLR